MGSDSEDGDEVKLYSALERNKKRQILVSFSSSSSEDEEEAFLPVRKRRRQAQKMKSPDKRKLGSSPSQSAASKPSSGPATVSLVDDDDDDDDDLWTPEERAAEILRRQQMEREVRAKLAKDTLLSQTRAIMSRTSTAQREIIALDSDSEDEGAHSSVVLPSVAAAPVAAVVAAVATAASKGERITLHVRSNGCGVDEIPIHARETFDVLYESFCGLHGLPRSAVKMSLDGEPLALSGTPQDSDLESGDLIDAKVDFTKQTPSKKKRFLRLRLVVFGQRSELFKIDATALVEKLHSSYCEKHGIADRENVVMSAMGRELELGERLDSYGFLDNDEVSVKIDNYVPPVTIELALRYADDTTQTHHVSPTAKVETLLEKVAKKKNSTKSAVTLTIDGERMVSAKTFQSYDLEGGEIIEVKIAS